MIFKKKNNKEKKIRSKKRWLIRFLVIIPTTLIFLIVISLVVVNLYLSPKRTESLIKENFEKSTYGKIDLDVKSFNPYGDIVIENIKITGGNGFKGEKLFTLKKLVLKYGLFKFLIGTIRFEEIGIYEPAIYLKQRGKRWNFESLAKESTEKKKIQEESSEEKSSDLSNEINLPISVEFFMKFILKDLKVVVDGEAMKTSFDGFDFDLNIDIPPVKKIPKSINAISIIKTFKINLNPDKLLNLSFNSKAATVKPPLLLNWNLILNNGKTIDFSSKFKIGTKNTPITLKNKYLGPMNVLSSYDLKYDPINDVLNLKDFSVSFGKNKFLSLSGVVRNVQKKPKINISMTESKISLTELYPLYRKITGDRRSKFGGEISLKPLTVNGGIETINILGNIKFKKIFYKKPGLSFFMPDGTISYVLNKKGKALKITSKIDFNRFKYVLQGNSSKKNSFSLRTEIKANESFTNIDIKRFAVYLYEPINGRRAFDFNMKANVIQKKSLALDLKIDKFMVDVTVLKRIVPDTIKKQLISVPLKKPLYVTMDAVVNQKFSKIKVNSNIKIKVPDYGLTDLKIKSNLNYDMVKKFAKLNNFKIYSKEFGVDVSANGIVNHKIAPFSYADLALSVNLDFPNKQLVPNWNFTGALNFATKFKGNLKNGEINGKLIANNINVSNKKTKLNLQKFNINFPFQYKINSWKKGKTHILTSKNEILGIERKKTIPNFTIESFSAKHPARNIEFEYVKDFTANINFSESLFLIKNLNANVLDGTVLGKTILFNLADLNKDNMEFKFVMDITNIDIGKIDRITTKGKKRDAELSMNINFQGKGLDISKELNVNGYIGIHKIGDEFANRLFKGLNEEKGESKLGFAQHAVDGFNLPNKFSYKLNNGLMYVTVSMERKILSYISGTHFENNEVKFERIPIQNYLRKVGKGE